MAFFNLIGGFKGIIIAVVIALALGWVVVQKRALSAAQLERDQAIGEKLAVQAELDKAILVAKTNEETISQLRGEKADLQISLNKRDADRNKNQQLVNKTNKSIDSQASNPLNQAPLSPVLKNTLEELRLERERRRLEGTK